MLSSGWQAVARAGSSIGDWLHPLLVVEPGKHVPNGEREDRMPPCWPNVAQRVQHEGTLVQPWVRHDEPRIDHVQNPLTAAQKVEVEWPCLIDGGSYSAEGLLY